MTDDQKTPGTAVAVRERLIVQAPVAIWDTAKFEQMQRVAVVLTKSGLVPETLCKGKWFEDGKEVEGYLSEAVVAARCTLVCNQANLWGADPLNVLQCTSLINGRLMYEGKLIAAVVASMTGVKLRYRFGKWNKDHIEFAPLIPLIGDDGEPVVLDGKTVMTPDPTFLFDVGEALAVRCFDPGDSERHVDGSVGQWKTTRSGSPWSSSSAWPRQLRYRASREWARAYEPGVILGILADGDQDIDEITMQAKPVGLMQRLKGEQTGDGFDADQVEQQTGGKRKRRTKAEMQAAAEPEEAMHASLSGASNEVAESYEAPLEAEPAASVVAELASSPTLPPTEEAQPDHLVTETAIEWAPGHPVDLTDQDRPTETGSGQQADDELPPAFQDFIDAVEAADSWAATKDALRVFYSTDVFKGMTPEQQNRVRRDTAETCMERQTQGLLTGLPDQIDDLSYFRLWVEAQEDADAINGTKATLERSAQWAASTEPMKAAINAAVAVRIERMQPTGPDWNADGR